jgi:hypothetical protein
MTGSDDGVRSSFYIFVTLFQLSSIPNPISNPTLSVLPPEQELSVRQELSSSMIPLAP